MCAELLQQHPLHLLMPVHLCAHSRSLTGKLALDGSLMEDWCWIGTGLVLHLSSQACRAAFSGSIGLVQGIFLLHMGSSCAVAPRRNNATSSDYQDWCMPMGHASIMRANLAVA